MYLNYIHCQIAEEAIRHKNHLAWKSLGMNYSETKRIYELAECEDTQYDMLFC